MLKFNARGCVLHTRPTFGSWQSQASFDRNVMSSNSTRHCLIEPNSWIVVKSKVLSTDASLVRRRDSDTPKKTLNRQSFLPSCCCHTIPQYHEYIVDHFTTTRSADVRIVLSQRELPQPTRFYDRFRPRPKRHKRRYCERIITGTFSTPIPTTKFTLAAEKK